MEWLDRESDVASGIDDSVRSDICIGDVLTLSHAGKVQPNLTEQNHGVKISTASAWGGGILYCILQCLFFQNAIFGMNSARAKTDGTRSTFQLSSWQAAQFLARALAPFFSCRRRTCKLP